MLACLLSRFVRDCLAHASGSRRPAATKTDAAVMQWAPAAETVSKLTSLCRKTLIP